MIPTACFTFKVKLIWPLPWKLQYSALKDVVNGNLSEFTCFLWCKTIPFPFKKRYVTLRSVTGVMGPNAGSQLSRNWRNSAYFENPWIWCFINIFMYIIRRGAMLYINIYGAILYIMYKYHYETSTSHYESSGSRNRPNSAYFTSCKNRPISAKLGLF